MRDVTNTQCKFQAEKCEFLEDEKKSIPFCLLYKYQTIVTAMIHFNCVYFIVNFNNIIHYWKVQVHWHNWDAYGWKHRYLGDSIHVLESITRNYSNLPDAEDGFLLSNFNKFDVGASNLPSVFCWAFTREPFQIICHRPHRRF